MKKAKKAVPDKHPICKRLNNIRIGLQLGYSELARQSDLPLSTVYNVLEGHTFCPRFSTVEKLVIGLDAGDMPIVEQKQRSADVYKVKFRR